MKKSLNYSMSVFILLLISTLGIVAQDTYQEESGMISLKGISTEQTIDINIQENTQTLNIAISSRVNKGNLSIELSAPNGNKYGSYNIGAKSNSSNKDSDMVQGRITKTINLPAVGQWKVRIMPQDAEGDVRISYKLFSAE